MDDMLKHHRLFPEKTLNRCDIFLYIIYFIIYIFKRIKRFIIFYYIYIYI